MQSQDWLKKRASKSATMTVSTATSFPTSQSSHELIDLTDHEPEMKRAKLQSSRPIVAAFQSQHNENLDAAFALAWACDALPFALLESPTFIGVLDAVRNSNCRFPSRKAIPLAQKLLAEKMRAEIITLLSLKSKTTPVTLALDGWTNTNGIKITNIILLIDGKAYYWTSISNDAAANTAAWMAPLIRDILDELIEHNICVSAIVADNEATNTAMYELLVPNFPYLVSIGCAAHVIQLVVNTTFKHEKLEALRSTVKDVIASFLRRKELRQQLALLQKVLIPAQKPVKLLQIVPTRWSSDRYAMIRLIRLKNPIQAVITANANEFTELPVNFWNDLEELVKFLQPMQIATDIMQSDSSTIYDIYVQFSNLLKHADSFHIGSSFYSAGRELRAAILLHWDRHVNRNAVICCAWLSFNVDITAQFPAAAIREAKAWFGDFASAYLAHHSMEEIDSQTFIDQLGDFLSLQEPFLAIHAEAVRRKSAVAVKAAAAPRDENEPPAKHVFFDPKRVWHHYIGELPAFVKVCCALLSICASEASVERSFSLQDRIHSDWRNALKHENIINQMFIHFNAMSPKHKPVANGAWIEIDENVDPALFSKSSMSVSSELQQPVVEIQQAVVESPALEPMQDDAIEGSVEARAARVAVNERYGYIIEATDMNSLCSAWLNTEAAKRAIGASNRIKFNADLEADLDLFM